MSYYRQYQQTERDRQMIYDYWDLRTLERVGKKYGITRERVRQVFEKNGFYVKEVIRAIADYELYFKIEAKYKTCKCGNFFILDSRREKRKRLIDLCSSCFMKVRSKVDGYKSNKAWRKKHPDYISPGAKESAKKFYEAHKKELYEQQKIWRKNNLERCKANSKNRYSKNRRYFLEWKKQWYVKNLLNKKDLI